MIDGKITSVNGSKIMAEMVTLALPEDVILLARQTASRTGRSVENVLTDWLEQGAAIDSSKTFVAETAYPIYTPLGNEAAAQVLYEFLKSAQTGDRDDPT